MTNEHAGILFDAMEADRQRRVTERFLLIMLTPGSTAHGSFTQAVEDESSQTEREMLLEEPTDGAA